MSKFKNKVVIVTGGSFGIGRGTALAFGREGASVVVAARSVKEGQATADEIVAAGGSAIFVQTDVTKESEVIRLVDETIKKFGRLDIAFNNAGVEQVPKPLPDQTEEEYYRIFDANVKGVWLCLKHQLPRMTDGGAVVNTSSLSAVQGFATVPLYAASKHAVVGLTQCIALEFGQRGIRINAVLPGATDTEMIRRSLGSNPEALQKIAAAHPLGRMARVADISAAVLFLCSDECFAHGQAITIDGGFTVG